MNLMRQLLNKFNSLEKREQNILLAGLFMIVFYLVYGVLYTGMVNERDRYARQNIADTKTLGWMKETAETINGIRGTSGISGGSAVSGKSLSQISEMAAKRSDVRISRFQPKDETEAQLWLDDVEFDKLVVFLSGLELDYSLSIQDLSVNAANAPGVVNARLKFSR